MQKLKEIAEWFNHFGVTLYLVGGCIRDELLGKPTSDIDVCVVGGNTAKNVHELLNNLIAYSSIQSVTSVHGDFPIWIVEIDGEKYEFAMARKERKIGKSRQEFECEINNVTIEEDLLRRDLTINAIAKNLLTGELIDPYGGITDLFGNAAVPVSKAFMEDELRVYRAARFIAKFDLYPSPKLIEYCKQMDYTKISLERVGMELKKVFETCKIPSMFFDFLREIGWLEYHFPELHATIGVPQNPEHHPEGDVYTHTMHCLDATSTGEVFQRAVMLCHDLGKVSTTEVDNIPFENYAKYSRVIDMRHAKVTAHGYEEAGVEPTKAMLRRICFASHDEIDRIACLVELHMIRINISSKNYDKVVRKTLRKLLKYKLNWEDLMLTVYYDLMGRPPLKYSFIDLTKELYWNYANKLLRSGAMQPIVTAARLSARGILPGPHMGKILSHALELQDRGTLRQDNWQKILKDCGYKLNL